ncbi:GCN5-related N-acetyltransferase [Bacillus cereus R309803]|nr:GCN5-related N-acetyltransferase [Bacillus cereus R309803]
MEAEFSDEQDALEKKVKSSCALHVVSHDNFLNWLELKIEEEVHEGIKN